MNGLRRCISLLILIFFIPFLTSCGLPKYREVEQLLVIQTMGLDYENGAVRLSLASAADGSGGEPRRLSSSGDSVTAAMERIYGHSYEQELFCYHVGHVLIGEAAAENDLTPYLNYICRSPVMRIDVPLYIVRSSTASRLVMDAGDDSKGISEIMQTVETKLEQRNGAHIFTPADVIRSLKRCGASLVCALDYTDSAESTSEQNGKDTDFSESFGAQSSSGKTAASAGYAVIRDGKLCGYLSTDDAAAADILMGNGGVFILQVDDGSGGSAALEVDSGQADISPRWNGNTLEGLDISVHVTASVLELNGRQPTSRQSYIDELTAALESVISDRANSVLQSSKSLHADFLGLATIIERSDPTLWRRMEGSFTDLLPGLDLNLSVSAAIRHTNDEIA